MNVELRCMTDLIYCLPLNKQAEYAENSVKEMTPEQMNEYVGTVEKNKPGPCQMVSGQTIANLSYIYLNNQTEAVTKLLFDNYKMYRLKYSWKLPRVNKRYLGMASLLGSVGVLCYALYRKYK